MPLKTRTTLGIGILVGGLLAVGVGIWWSLGPSEDRVRQTILTTMQEEAPASFLVTGSMDMSVTVHLDSSQYMTPDWLTYVLQQTHPSALSMLKGTSETRVRVPGRVSYGFEVGALTPEMIRVEADETVVVQLPPLSVYSVEPELDRLEVETTAEGWLRIIPSDVHEEVRTRALARVEEAFRAQVEEHFSSSVQPRVNTARALKEMLAPPLKAVGMSDPSFRIQIGEEIEMRRGE